MSIPILIPVLKYRLDRRGVTADAVTAPRRPANGEHDATEAEVHPSVASLRLGSPCSQGGSPLVIIRKCSSCQEPSPEGLTWTVGAWNLSDGSRVAYKHKLGLECLAARIVPLSVACESPVMTCPSCGIDTAEDYDAVYVTWIPRGVGPQKIDAPFCGACAALFRIWFQEGAERLEDREISSRGQDTAPRPSSLQVLEALGWRPRDEA